MAESSITHSFIVSDPDAVERFAKALEEAANDPPMPITVKARILKDPDEIRELIHKVNRANEAKASTGEKNGID